MQVLVGWDDEVEAETIQLILNVEEVEVEVTTDATEFKRLFTEQKWDVILMTTNFPNQEEALGMFLQVTEAHPHIPVVGVWKQGEFTNLARFISNGLHSHLRRDPEGDYIFLLPSMLEAASPFTGLCRAMLISETARSGATDC